MSESLKNSPNEPNDCGLYWSACGPPDADTIVFLHAGGYRGSSWAIATELLPGFRCLMPDLPGHGGSQDIPLGSVEQAADAVAELITQRGGPVHIVGLSFGSYVGLKLMTRHPHLIKKAIISGVQVGAIPNAGLMNVTMAMMSPLIRFEWFRRRSAAQMGIVDPSIYNRPDGSSNLSPKTLRTVGRLAASFDIEAELPSIQSRTLLLAGEREHPLILNSLGTFAALIPHCAARVVADAGHPWPVRKPHLFAQTLTAWINEMALPEELRPIASS